MNDYLNGDLSSASYLHNIYPGEGDYYNKGEVPLSAVIADKLAYVHRWDSLQYRAQPGSIKIEPVAGHQSTYRVAFDYDYLVAKWLRVLQERILMVDLSGSSPRITAEHGSLLSRAVQHP